MRSKLLAAVLACLTLTACEGGVVTSIDVNGDGSARISVSAELLGEAAAAVAGDQALVDDLASNMERLTGKRPTIDLSADRVVASSPVDVDTLGRSSGITGVSTVSSASGDETVTVSVSMVQPAQLLSSLATAAEGRPDRDAYLAALEANTYVKVQVAMPAEAEVIQVQNASPAVEGNVVEVKRLVTDKKAGSFVVSSSTSDASFPLWPWALVLLSLGGLVLWYRRR